ncbi:GNAT family N-acetyltransferase [Knoellia subterranea]|uniref:GNAT family N-acetyltransferase n=1 Tax=Knoellia subterranea TaxID=184882 RepID=UPI00056031CE|nr:GNAT family protein [Knoellia subterranea]
MPSTTIRLVRPDDTDALLEHLVRDRGAFERWEPARPDDYYTPLGQRQRVESYLEAFEAGRMWPGVVLSGTEVAGFITVSDIRRGPFQAGSVGYWIGTSHQGKGHAQRALGRLLDLMAGELDLHRAEASTALDNGASHRVLESQGFRRIGTSTSSFHGPEGWRDSVLWERVL